MPMGLPHRIAIVGAGPIGSALAGHLILAGNNVTIGTRRPEAFTPPDYQREDIDYPVRTIEAAIDGAEVAILAIPNAAVAPFAEVYRDRLAGAVIIDPSNPVRWHDDGVMTIKDLVGKTSGTVTAELFPKSSVARAEYPPGDLSVWDWSPARRRNRNLLPRNCFGRFACSQLVGERVWACLYSNERRRRGRKRSIRGCACAGNTLPFDAHHR